MPVLNDRPIPAQQGFTHAVIWTQRPLGNHHAAILAFNDKAAQPAGKMEQFAQDLCVECMVLMSWAEE
jgi:hypothetical protein